MDTPGLADIDLRRAWNEIVGALSQSGKCFKLNFVCSFESGRILAEDIVTINLVGFCDCSRSDLNSNFHCACVSVCALYF